MKRRFQGSGSSPPSRYVIKKRDRERLKRLDSKISKLTECYLFCVRSKLPSGKYKNSIEKFDMQRKNLRNKMKGYNVDAKAEEAKGKAEVGRTKVIETKN